MVDGESGCTSVNQDQMVDGEMVYFRIKWSMVMVGVLQ